MRSADFSYSPTPIRMRSDRVIPPQVIATVPIPRAVFVATYHVHVAFPCASVIFGPRPGRWAIRLSGVVYAMVQRVFGGAATVAEALPPGSVPVMDDSTTSPAVSVAETIGSGVTDWLHDANSTITGSQSQRRTLSLR